jgi:hypothetical protein
VGDEKISPVFFSMVAKDLRRRGAWGEALSLEK